MLEHGLATICNQRINLLFVLFSFRLRSFNVHLQQCLLGVGGSLQFDNPLRHFLGRTELPAAAQDSLQAEVLPLAYKAGAMPVIAFIILFALIVAVV